MGSVEFAPMLASKAFTAAPGDDAYLIAEDLLAPRDLETSQRTIPEPATATLIGFGLAAIAWRQRSSTGEKG